MIINITTSNDAALLDSLLRSTINASIDRDCRISTKDAAIGFVREKLFVAQNPIARRHLLLMLIEINGQAYDLNLEGVNLSGVDLSSETMRRFANDGVAAAWQTTHTWGRGLLHVSLERMNLVNANFSKANLTGVSFILSNLNGANFSDAQLVDANLYKASFRGGGFRRANFQGATAGKADFQFANLYRANFQGANLSGADLRYANLEHATLSGSNLSDAIIGNELLQENKEILARLIQRDIKDERPDFDASFIFRERFRAASDIYNEIKNSYAQTGKDELVGEAHFRERRMRRLARNPLTARRSFSDEFKLTNTLSAKFAFHLKYFVMYISDWFSEVILGYGEKPARVAITATCCILGFALIHFLNGGVYFLDQKPGINAFILYSLASFLLYELPGATPATNMAKLLTALEGLMGVSLLALLMYTLGNRMTR